MPVVLHRFVIVEVIASEVCKNGNGVFKFVATVEVHCLRGTLHHRRATSDLNRTSQQSLHVRGFRRGAIRFETLLAETVLDGARHRDRLACFFGD